MANPPFPYVSNQLCTSVISLEASEVHHTLILDDFYFTANAVATSSAKERIIRPFASGSKA